MIESFWSRMQVELLDRQSWRTRVELAYAIFEHLEIPQSPAPALGARHAYPIRVRDSAPASDGGMKSRRLTPRNRGHLTARRSPGSTLLASSPKRSGTSDQAHTVCPGRPHDASLDDRPWNWAASAASHPTLSSLEKAIEKWALLDPDQGLVGQGPRTLVLA